MKILDGTKLLAITDGSGKEYRFLGVAEKEVTSAKMYYYLWLSRFFIFTASLMLIMFTALSLSLFKLAPQVTVEPFLIIEQNSSDSIVRYEPIEFDMASKNLLMETFVKQYVVYRNNIIADEREMMVRWWAGGIVNYLSSPEVFDEFSEYRESVWQSIIRAESSQETEIISISRVGGANSQTWKVDFKTYEVSSRNRNSRTGSMILNVRYWTASLISYFIPGREFMGIRLLNPLGFTVMRYSQSEVEFI